MKLLRTTHIIDIQRPAECEDEILRESDAYKALLQRLNLESNLNLAVGAIVANEMRDAVLEQTHFTCSAGIAHNKVSKCWLRLSLIFELKYCARRAIFLICRAELRAQLILLEQR